MVIIKRLFLALFFITMIVLLTIHGAFVIIARKNVNTNGFLLPARSTISFRVDEKFTTTERILIMDVFQEIRNVSGCIELTANFVPIRYHEILTWRKDQYATIYKASHPFSWQYHISRHLSGPGSYMGIAMIVTGDIFIMSAGDESGIDFKNAVEHEVLHVVFNSGWHSSNGKSLMYPSIGGGDQRLLNEEITALRAICATRKLQKDEVSH